jgi:toxin ParE1/3/4
VRIRWLRTALANLNAEAEYIARDSPAAAARMVATIASAVEHLVEHPAMGRSGRVSGTRELFLPATPDIALYRVRHNAVEVLRVFPAARKWPSRF